MDAFIFPLFVCIAITILLALKNRLIAMYLGLLLSVMVIAITSYVYDYYQSLGHHIQDNGRIPDVAVGIADHVPGLRTIKVDHVYFYTTGMLRCNYYLRCHIIDKADFEKIRRLIYSDLPPENVLREKANIVKWNGVESCDYKKIKSWWDWPERSNCEVFCRDPAFVFIFDEARSILYVVLGDD